MKILITILLCVGLVQAYMGDFHAKVMETVPGHLRSAGYDSEADTVEKYMGLIKKGAPSPDDDYSEFKIPEDAVPEWLKPATSTSPVKFEHVLVDDIPEVIDTLLKKIAKIMGVPFRYADETFVAWNKKAQVFWHAGNKDSAMWHMARCCHLLHDLTVPMHTKLTGNLIDSWQVLSHEDPNHDKFELYCSENYVPNRVKPDLNEEFDIPGRLYQIARESRKTLKLCDGIEVKYLDWPPINWILPWVREDYEKAARLCTQRAEKYTAIYIHYFLKTVMAGPENMASF